jgi:hypothetical protein
MTTRAAAAYVILLAAATLAPVPLLGAQTRTLRTSDVFALRDVADPRLSPDGRLGGYTVTAMDAKADESDTDVFMVPFAGGGAVGSRPGRSRKSSPLQPRRTHPRVPLRP